MAQSLVRHVCRKSGIHQVMSSSFVDLLNIFEEQTKEIFTYKYFNSESNIIFIYEHDEYNTIPLNFDRYFKLNKKHIRLTNISNHCVSTCANKSEKEVINELDKIPFNSKENEKEKKYYVSIRSNHGENIASDLEFNTLSNECQIYFQSLIDDAG